MKFPFCRKMPVLPLLLLAVSAGLGAAEYTEGRIKLVLNENSGRFSLFYLSDAGREDYIPLFYNEDPRTSFLAVQVDRRNYRMGETASFKVSIGGTASDPALVFDSPSLTVTESFSFIRTSGSYTANGVKITIAITNKSDKTVQAGARFLLDTSLGEGTTNHFSTPSRQIISETSLEAGSGENRWVSGNGAPGLMGSVSAPGFTEPGAVHFANWKRLNDAAWKTTVSPGRNFNLLPYSIGDSAVCYYFEPSALEPGSTRTITLALAAQDPAGFAGYTGTLSGELARFLEESAGRLDDFSPEAMRSDLVLLRDVNAFIDSRTASKAALSGAELEAVQMVISRLKTKYGVP